LYTLEYDRYIAEQGARYLGATEFRRYENVSYEEFNNIIKDLQNELRDNQKAGKKTFVYFHYGGHGIQDNFTYAICNASRPLKEETKDATEKLPQVKFPLE